MYIVTNPWLGKPLEVLNYPVKGKRGICLEFALRVLLVNIALEDEVVSKVFKDFDFCPPS